MTTAPHQVHSWHFRQRFGLLGAVALFLAGCPHSPGPTKAATGTAGDACGNLEALLKGTTPGSCTVAQRICLIARDLPSTLSQPDFVPAAGYTARGQSHVSAWLTQLTEIAKEPALASYAQGARHKLEQVNASQHDRSLVVESGDLVYALKLLAQKAETAAPPIALDCQLPE